MRIMKYHSDILRAIGANMVPEQEYRLLIMVHRNARFRELRMEEGPQIVKILAKLQVETERQTRRSPIVPKGTSNACIYIYH